MSVDKSNKNKEKNLKTLKDLEFEWDYKYSDTYPVVDVEKLKEEAIKWYKEWEITNGIGSAAVLEWIKHFFNLTEEELE